MNAWSISYIVAIFLILSGCRTSTKTADYAIAFRDTKDIALSLSEYYRKNGELPDNINEYRTREGKVVHNIWDYDQSAPSGIILTSKESYRLGDGRVFFHVTKDFEVIWCRNKGSHQIQPST